MDNKMIEVITRIIDSLKLIVDKILKLRGKKTKHTAMWFSRVIDKIWCSRGQTDIQTTRCWQGQIKLNWLGRYLSDNFWTNHTWKYIQKDKIHTFGN